jgi:16S rRNA (adenine1518-N6/adenine1519-N6)-dimethyltransferase
MTPLQAKLQQRLQMLGGDPKRSLGQNFLVSETVVTKILAAVAELKPSRILEVGPGLGALTDGLLDLSVQMQVVELDRRFAAYWAEERGVTCVNEDALALNWHQLQLPSGWVLASNLPYQISSSLVIERSLAPMGCAGMVLMFQKEVAQRITAQPRTADYGLLTVMAQPFWTVDRVADAGPAAFWPAPKVSSRVLRFRPKKSEISDRQGYLALVKAGFAQRRKLVRKNLSVWAGRVGLTQESLTQILTEAGAGEKARAEELSIEQWAKVYEGWKSWESK